MNNQELLDELERIAKACVNTNPRIAAILYTIMGTINMGPEAIHSLYEESHRFSTRMVAEAQRQIANIRSRNN